MEGIRTRRHLRRLALPPYELLRNSSLFLDLDGTIVEIAARPDEVSVDESLIQLLNRLVLALCGRVAVVSGRALGDVSGLLKGVQVSIVGSHGSEFRTPDGRKQEPPPREPPEHVLARLRGLAAAHPGVLIETKPLGLAIHYRLAPNAAAECLELARDIASAEGYGLQRGKKVVELKYHHMNKGDAVRTLMDSPPLGLGRPLFIGDDLTDEAGFAVAEELGGAGILVGPHRTTCASYRIPDVKSALRWLDLAMVRAS